MSSLSMSREHTNVATRVAQPIIGRAALMLSFVPAPSFFTRMVPRRRNPHSCWAPMRLQPQSRRSMVSRPICRRSSPRRDQS